MPIGKKVDDRMELALEKSMSILVVGVAAEPILQKRTRKNLVVREGGLTDVTVTELTGELPPDSRCN